MYLVLYFILGSWTFESYAVYGDKSALCSSWNSIKQNLKNEEFQFTCSEDEDCTSLNCSGTARGYFVNSRIQLYSCENPPSIEFEVNVPHLNVNNFKKRISQNDSISLTSNLNVEFEVQRKDQELVLAIFLHYINNGSFPLLRISPRIPVISHVGFPINCSSSVVSMQPAIDGSKSISSATVRTTKSYLIVPKALYQKDSRNCSITNSSCGPDEMCQQSSKVNLDGKCVCLSGYKRDESGRCVYDPTLDSSTEGPDHHSTTDAKGTSNASLLLTAILVPISVILILVAIVYASIRFRICQHLRRRLRVQVYEHVLLGEDDEEEEDLRNPVA